MSLKELFEKMYHITTIRVSFIISYNFYIYNEWKNSIKGNIKKISSKIIYNIFIKTNKLKSQNDK